MLSVAQIVSHWGYRVAQGGSSPAPPDNPFLVARYLAADWVAHKAHGKLQHLIEGVEKEGWRFVAFVRLVPVFPFNLLNYALGLTRIRLSHYVLASYLCMLPGALAYTYLGYAGREAAAGGAGLIQKGLLALGLVALVAFLPRWIKRWRAPDDVPFLAVQELRERMTQHADVLVLGAAEFVGELGHIAGASNLAVEELSRRATELKGTSINPRKIFEFAGLRFFPV